MALNIKDSEADRLARELARATGATLTEAVKVALKERLQRVQARHPGRSLADELDDIALHCARLPDLDERTADEIVGYESAMTSRGCPVDGARAMVIDTSALLAILLDEPERHGFNEHIAGAAIRLMSSASFLETAIVIETRKGESGARDLDLFLHQAAIEVVAVDHNNQAQIARLAYRTYGKGNHPAGLTFGDCSAYALAKATGEPLLFKGQDFSQTDLPSCVQASESFPANRLLKKLRV